MQYFSHALFRHLCRPIFHGENHAGLLAAISYFMMTKSVFLNQLQFEIFLQFVTGSMDLSETYCDDFKVISAKYLSSFSGFWFDTLTSVPWSFNDLYAYQVTFSAMQWHAVAPESDSAHLSIVLKIATP